MDMKGSKFIHKKAHFNNGQVDADPNLTYKTLLVGATQTSSNKNFILSTKIIIIIKDENNKIESIFNNTMYFKGFKN